MTTTPLPPLPTPKGKVYFEAEPYQPAWVSSSDAFDDDQMQDYATQARADLEAENQRLREALEELLRHFTRSPSSLADSETRIKAHAALEGKP